ncbi:MAG: ADP-forming succinate--CoA ligase subunit beta [Proteobacteria bacterium]|jgi:succinyl-CoA synthetase beta subunit|nr:ADP-forming succinate--CoA ligase subunit beta [Pseudomonadota bacterium]
MNIHEFQAKEVLRKYGVATLKGQIASTADEAAAAAKALGGNIWVVKAQIHAGGRGKGGGVKLAKTIDEVKMHAQNIIGMQLITHQTGPEGKQVNRVYVEQGCNIAKELYVAALVDRATGRVAMMASSEGGMDIEEVAEKHPEAIKKVDVDPVTGLIPFQARQLGFAIGVPAESINKFTSFMMALYKAFVEKDCSIAEINPLVLTKEGDLIALDAKMNFDSNSLYRQKDIVEYRDLTEEEPTEIEASKYDLAFIKLDGNIGCLVNGAGLAMATLDIIKLHGEAPANFLDVGGGANKEKVTAAFKIILQDPNVKGILVNIFGGIMKCDIIAEGVIAASKEVGLKVPLVVRLEGTNVELGKKMLTESGLNITPANDLTDAAQKIVKAVRGK